MTSVSGLANSANSTNISANLSSKVTAEPTAQQAANTANQAISQTSDSANNAVTASATKPLPNTGDSTTVTLSSVAQDKLAAEQTGAKPAAAEAANKASEEDGGDIESFVFGALGLDHPEEIDENGDPSYSAGQYVKAAATVGGMIAMFI